MTPRDYLIEITGSKDLQIAQLLADNDALREENKSLRKELEAYIPAGDAAANTSDGQVSSL